MKVNRLVRKSQCNFSVLKKIHKAVERNPNLAFIVLSSQYKEDVVSLACNSFNFFSCEVTTPNLGIFILSCLNVDLASYI